MAFIGQIDAAGGSRRAPGCTWGSWAGRRGWLVALFFFQLHQFSLMKAITSPYQPYLAAELLQIAASPFGRQSRPRQPMQICFFQRTKWSRIAHLDLRSRLSGARKQSVSSATHPSLPEEKALTQPTRVSLGSRRGDAELSRSSCRLPNSALHLLPPWGKKPKPHLVKKAPGVELLCAEVPAGGGFPGGGRVALQNGHLSINCRIRLKSNLRAQFGDSQKFR